MQSHPTHHLSSPSSAVTAALSAATTTLAELNRQVAVNDDVLTKLQQELSHLMVSTESRDRSFRSHRLLLQEEVVTINGQTEKLKSYFANSLHVPSLVHLDVPVINHRGFAMIPEDSLAALTAEKTAKQNALSAAEEELRALAKVYGDAIRSDPSVSNENNELQDALALYIATHLVLMKSQPQ